MRSLGFMLCGAMFLVGTTLGGCGDSDAPPSQMCLDALATDCAPLWDDYDAIYDQMLIQRCGSAGTATACHGPEGQMGGLLLNGRQAAYDSLLGADGPAQVVPGSPECSPVMQRLLSSDPTQQMPPGNALTETEKCSIIRWISAGAER